MTGCINTTFFRPSDPSDPLSPPLVVGTNTDTPACLSVLLSSFLSLPSPFPPSAPRAFSPAAKDAALAVGGGGATRAAVHALQQLGCAPIYVVNRDEGETEAMRAHFAKWRWDVRALRSVGDAERELEGLEKDGGRVVCGVGAIPCAEPTTDGERMVYDVAEAVFARRYERRAGEAEDEGTLRLPERPVFVGASLARALYVSSADRAHRRHGIQAADDQAPRQGRGAWLEELVRHRGRLGTHRLRFCRSELVLCDVERLWTDS